MDLERRHTGDRAGGRANLRREVRQRREIVAEHGRRIREPTAGQLHAIARVPGHAYYDPFARLGPRVLSLHVCSLSHYAADCKASRSRFEGEGPAVLLLHGFPDRSNLWRHQIDALKSDFTVIAPDLRGFGDSDKPDDVDAYRVGKSVGDVVAILDELGIEQAHVVGHDFGAAVAWAFALSVPERLDRLVVLSVGHPGVPTDFAQREKSWYMLLFQFEEAEELLRRGDWAFLREWVGDAPRARPRHRRPPASGRADRRAELVPREPPPAPRARSTAGLPAGHRADPRRLEHG